METSYQDKTNKNKIKGSLDPDREFITDKVKQTEVTRSNL